MPMELDLKAVVLIFAMVGVTIMTCVAMLSGHDGQTYMGGIGALITIAGYLFASSIQVRRVEVNREEEEEDTELIEG